jgi:hypothetical protein
MTIEDAGRHILRGFKRGDEARRIAANVARLTEVLAPKLNEAT